jgi:hypothetical protein
LLASGDPAPVNELLCGTAGAALRQDQTGAVTAEQDVLHAVAGDAVRRGIAQAREGKCIGRQLSEWLWLDGAGALSPSGANAERLARSGVDHRH